VRPGPAADDGPDLRAQVRGVALGRRLRVLRTAAGLDPVELAGAAGLDPGTYRRVEGGDPATLTYLDLLALSAVLAVSPDTVLADPEEG
jgi:transcriptional regulator with XRE-family HTH domain